jgi:hypothetical protein
MNTGGYKVFGKFAETVMQPAHLLAYRLYYPFRFLELFVSLLHLPGGFFHLQISFLLPLGGFLECRSDILKGNAPFGFLINCCCHFHPRLSSLAQNHGLIHILHGDAGRFEK